MQYSHTTHRLIVRRIVTAAMAFAMLCPSFASAQTEPARLEFRPHCDTGNEVENVFGGPMPDSQHMIKVTDGRCAPYEVRDPTSLQTNVLKEGDVIDMDIVMHNPDRKPIKRFRAWIAYDPSTLKGEDIAISDDFPTPTPGETDFSESEGLIKLSGTARASQRDEELIVARVRMRVQAVRSSGTPLTFSPVTNAVDSTTGMFAEESGQETNILSPTLGYLFVRFDGAQNQSSSLSSAAPIQPLSASSAASFALSSSSSAFDTSLGSSSIAASSSSSVAAVAPASVFTMLQVQGLRVTTEGSSVFLAWDALPSTELVGYNVYYGTITGKYIQRRSVEKNATSLTLRALPVGTTYYFAVRGVNSRNQETEFSQEVGISVGNPATSTSPLIANTLPTQTPPTGGSVAGNTGSSSMLLLFFALSAVIGTTLAFRRQLSASRA